MCVLAGLDLDQASAEPWPDSRLTLVPKASGRFTNGQVGVISGFSFSNSFALVLPAVCATQCESAVERVKAKIEASEESDTYTLVQQLNKHGCGHGLGFEPADQGFVYRILLLNTTKPRATITMAGVGSTYEPIVVITVYDDKRTELFDFARSRAMRITHKGTVNASAKEIIKRLVQLRSHK
jgi:hypothetical protein